MKCPHCGQNMENRVDEKVKEKALKLYAEGKLSLREISKKLDDKISPSTISRLVKEKLREIIKQN